MLFKRNEAKAFLKKEIKAKRSEIAERTRLHKKWIKAFMEEHDPGMAAIQIAVIKKQADEIANEEILLELMKKQYKLL